MKGQHVRSLTRVSANFVRLDHTRRLRQVEPAKQSQRNGTRARHWYAGCCPVRVLTHLRALPMVSFGV
jgi:hypothetical protein